MVTVANKPVSNTKVAYEKVVIVTRKTELEELTARFNSVPQAQFYLEHAGQDFSPSLDHISNIMRFWTVSEAPFQIGLRIR